jgi:hypothetical protein
MKTKSELVATIKGFGYPMTTGYTANLQMQVSSNQGKRFTAFGGIKGNSMNKPNSNS